MCPAIVAHLLLGQLSTGEWLATLDRLPDQQAIEMAATA